MTVAFTILTAAAVFVLGLMIGGSIPPHRIISETREDVCEDIERAILERLAMIGGSDDKRDAPGLYVALQIVEQLEDSED